MSTNIPKGRWAIFIVLCTLIPYIFLFDAPSASAKDPPKFQYGTDTDLSSVDASIVGIDGIYMYYSKGTIIKDGNGDGLDDLLLGVPVDKQVAESPGKIYLFFGKEVGWSRNMSINDADATFLGERLGAKAGYFIASAGDVNGDGFNDILISAAGDSEAGGDTGQLYLILGKKTGWSKNVSLGNVDASFSGEKDGDNIAMGLGQPGDINSDGYDDILLGTHHNGAYIIFGKPKGWHMDTSISKADASFKDDEKNDDFGTIVSMLGDVNGDGIDDFVVGSENDYNTDMGMAYLFFGKSTGWSKGMATSSADVIISGQQGLQVAMVGDVNGDGVDDILWGYPENYYNLVDYFSYKIFLTFGTRGPWAKNINDNTGTVSFQTDKNFTNVLRLPGLSLCGAGDVNNDGFSDLLIEVRITYNGGNFEDEVYLVLGKPTEWTSASYLIDAEASFVGEKMGDTRGWGLSGGGDINGDGNDDLYIASNTKGYLIFPMLGKPDKRPTLGEIADQTTVEGKAFGFSVKASDEDGDPLTFALTSAPSGMTIDRTGRISYTPTTQDGGLDETVVVMVSDGIKSTSTQFKLKVVSLLPPVTVGPILGENGKPLENATISLSDGVQTRSATTDSYGKASVEVPSAWARKNMTISIEKTGWVGATAPGQLTTTGTFQPTTGSYPIMTRPVKTTVAGNHYSLIVFMGLILLMVLIIKTRDIIERKSENK